MLLIVVNHENEIDKDFFSQYDFVDIKVLKENKWSIFALKLQKFLLKEKYDFVLHFGICWWKSKDMIWDIYKIDRTFLFHDNNIVDNQRNRLWKLQFKTIKTNNIVTKFNIWEHSDLLYDFADIYDLESFWVAQLSTQTSIPIISIKWVSDINNFSKIDEMDFLLNPESKRQRQKLLLDNLKDNISKVNKNFQTFFTKEFVWFYEKYITDKDFRKSI